MASVQQLFWDHVFLLNMFQFSAEPLDNLKIQKLVFVTEDRARTEKFAAADFPFFRFTYGPFSKYLAEDVRFLEDSGFVDSEYRHPTERGQFILDYVGEFIKHSPQAVEALRLLYAVCQEYRDTKSSTLVDIVHRMKVSVVGLGGEVMAVQDVPRCMDIIVPEQERLSLEIPFPADLIEDLKIEFSRREPINPDSPENVTFAIKALDQALAS